MSDVIRSVRVFVAYFVGEIHATLLIDNPDANPAFDVPLPGHWVPESGLFIFDLPEAWPAPFGVNLHVTAPGYQDFKHHFATVDFTKVTPEPDNPNLFIQRYEDTEPWIQMVPEGTGPTPPVHPPSGELLPVAVDDKWFRTSDGAPWLQNGCTDFRLFERFLRGEDITGVLNQRVTLGFNQLRVLLMCDLMFHLYPQEHGDYLHQLELFVNRVGASGLRLELTVFADATRVMNSTSQQQGFFHNVCEAVADSPHVFLELVNENEQTINTINTDAFTQPSGIVCSHGSKGVVDAAREPVCVTPIWSYGTLHPARPPDWPRLGGHNTMEDVADKHGKPGTDNESCRPDQGRGPIPSDWFDAAGNIALLCAGGTFHSQSGKDSVGFSQAELDCAYAWNAGINAVPLSYQRGAYIAGHLSGFPINWAPGDSARAHGRLAGDRACLSLPQMREGYNVSARPGWRITKQTGSVVEVQAQALSAAEKLMTQARALRSTAD